MRRRLDRALFQATRTSDLGHPYQFSIRKNQCPITGESMAARETFGNRWIALLVSDSFLRSDDASANRKHIHDTSASSFRLADSQQRTPTSNRLRSLKGRRYPP